MLRSGSLSHSLRPVRLLGQSAHAPYVEATRAPLAHRRSRGLSARPARLLARPGATHLLPGAAPGSAAGVDAAHPERGVDRDPRRDAPARLARRAAPEARRPDGRAGP